LSQDPIRFESGDANQYRYVQGDPLDFVDPSGNKIVPIVGPNGGGNDLVDYLLALIYLKKDPACAKVIKKLEKSKRKFKLEFVRDGNDRYDPATRTVYWDPKSGLICTNGSGQTPALGLCHEMAHAAGDGPIARHMSITPDDQYDWREERRVIRTYETPFAIRNGEGVRHDHGGDAVNVPTSIPLP
jgi:hypothetical protein